MRSPTAKRGPAIRRVRCSCGTCRWMRSLALLSFGLGAVAACAAAAPPPPAPLPPSALPVPPAPALSDTDASTDATATAVVESGDAAPPQPVVTTAPPLATSTSACNEQAPQDFLIRGNFLKEKDGNARAIQWRTDHYGWFPGFGRPGPDALPPSASVVDTTFMGLPVKMHRKVVPGARAASRRTSSSPAPTTRTRRTRSRASASGTPTGAAR